MNTPTPSTPILPAHLVDALMRAQQVASLLALMTQRTINGAPVDPGQTAALADCIAIDLDRVVMEVIGE